MAMTGHPPNIDRFKYCFTGTASLGPHQSQWWVLRFDSSIPDHRVCPAGRAALRGRAYASCDADNRAGVPNRCGVDPDGHLHGLVGPPVRVATVGSADPSDPELSSSTNSSLRPACTEGGLLGQPALRLVVVGGLGFLGSDCGRLAGGLCPHPVDARSSKQLGPCQAR
jgi:hypothetical protein